MKYVGSKGRHAKQILPIILADRKPGQTYVEPFVGGANTIQHVDGRRIGGDMHPQLISLWKAVSSGWKSPKSVSEEDYADAKLRHKKGVISPDIGHIGFAVSFGGKWFGGFARGKRADGSMRDFGAEAHSHAEKQFPKLIGVEFHCCSYRDLPIPEESLIYCDPPYADSQGYSTGGFDNNAFWQWVRERVYDGHKVFVSEYSAPSDFVCVWSKTVNNTLDKDTGAKSAVEKLFVHESQHGR